MKSLFLFFILFGGWSVEGSVGVVRGPVRRWSADWSAVGVRGPGVSVFGSPGFSCVSLYIDFDTFELLSADR